MVIELKSQGEEEALEDQPPEERLPPQAERDCRVPPRPYAARAEAMMHAETEKRLREEDDDEQGWELVKKSTSSYEVLGTLPSSFFFVLFLHTSSHWLYLTHDTISILSLRSGPHAVSPFTQL